MSIHQGKGLVVDAHAKRRDCDYDRKAFLSAISGLEQPPGSLESLKAMRERYCTLLNRFREYRFSHFSQEYEEECRDRTTIIVASAWYAIAQLINCKPEAIPRDCSYDALREEIDLLIASHKARNIIPRWSISPEGSE